MKRGPALLGAVALLLAAAPLRAQAARSAPPAAPAEALLRPGDVVALKIWREKDLTGEFDVDADGVVVFPKIGPMQVTALAPDTLRERLLEAYGRYLRNPSIEITFMRRVTILGAVHKPGLYPVSPTMTIADALALAGGATSEGKADRIEVVRDGERIKTKLSQRTRIADSPITSGDQIFVPERSWASRNTPIVATVISAATSLFIALRR
ncbi:MAG TPA: polysaccharide biosynthesis/export family protein [Longimicrobiales bacterium]|nr:polysaccharide biosynthesis/export family protein [Longimicrobiales bacterium]